jgi:ribosomal protein L39E
VGNFNINETELRRNWRRNEIISTAKKWQKSDFKRGIEHKSGQFTGRKYHVHPQRPPKLQSVGRFRWNSQKKVCCGATPGVSATRFGLFTIWNCDVVGFLREFLVAFGLEGLEFRQKQQQTWEKLQTWEELDTKVVETSHFAGTTTSRRRRWRSSSEF